MNIGEAQDLARRWLFHRNPPKSLGARVGALLDPDGGFSDVARERLYAWVQKRMAQLGGADRRPLAVFVASELGWPEADAYALCEAAGWPS